MVRSQRLRRTRRMTRTTRLLTEVARMRVPNSALVIIIVALACAIVVVDRSVQPPAPARLRPIILLATPAPRGASGLAKQVEHTSARPRPTIAPTVEEAPAAPVVEAAPPTAAPEIVQAALDMTIHERPSEKAPPP